MSSGPQFCYWLSSSLCQALALGSQALGPSLQGRDSHRAINYPPTTPDPPLWAPVLSSLSLALTLAVLLLSFWADQPPLYTDLASKSD